MTAKIISTSKEHSYLLEPRYRRIPPIPSNKDVLSSFSSEEGNYILQNIFKFKFTINLFQLNKFNF